MLVLAYTAPTVSKQRMSDTMSPEEADRRLMGEALRRMRRERNLTQAAMAEAMGVTTQAYQRYEAGDRKFTPDLMDRLGGAMGVSVEELEEAKARMLDAPSRARSKAVPEGPTPPSRIPVWGRVRASPTGPQIYDGGDPEAVIETAALFGPDTAALRIAGESMEPWGEPGELIIFDRGRYPKRGHGCVVETVDGEYYVKLYEKTDGSRLYVRQLSPNKLIDFPLAKVKGVYSVRLRGD